MEYHSVSDLMESILSDTLNYIKGNPHLFVGTKLGRYSSPCYYSQDPVTGVTKRCLVARYMVQPEKYVSDHRTIQQIVRDEGTSVFHPEYREIPVWFWVRLQLLHDDYFTRMKYWDSEAKLTIDGESFIDYLKERIAVYDAVPIDLNSLDKAEDDGTTP